MRFKILDFPALNCALPPQFLDAILPLRGARPTSSVPELLGPRPRRTSKPQQGAAAAPRQPMRPATATSLLDVNGDVRLLMTAQLARDSLYALRQAVVTCRTMRSDIDDLLGETVGGFVRNNHPLWVRAVDTVDRMFRHASARGTTDLASAFAPLLTFLSPAQVDMLAPRAPGAGGPPSPHEDNDVLRRVTALAPELAHADATTTNNIVAAAVGIASPRLRMHAIVVLARNPDALTKAQVQRLALAFPEPIAAPLLDGTRSELAAAIAARYEPWLHYVEAVAGNTLWARHDLTFHIRQSVDLRLWNVPETDFDNEFRDEVLMQFVEAAAHLGATDFARHADSIDNVARELIERDGLAEWLENVGGLAGRIASLTLKQAVDALDAIQRGHRLASIEMLSLAIGHMDQETERASQPEIERAVHAWIDATLENSDFVVLKERCHAAMGRLEQSRYTAVIDRLRVDRDRRIRAPDSGGIRSLMDNMHRLTHPQFEALVELVVPERGEPDIESLEGLPATLRQTPRAQLVERRIGIRRMLDALEARISFPELCLRELHAWALSAAALVDTRL